MIHPPPNVATDAKFWIVAVFGSMVSLLVPLLPKRLNRLSVGLSAKSLTRCGTEESSGRIATLTDHCFTGPTENLSLVEITASFLRT